MTSSAASTRCSKRPRALATRRWFHRRFSAAAAALALLGAFTAHAAQDPACAPATGAEAIIEKVIDGDTVALSDGERVRMVGIDTPELRGSGSPEPGALEARDWLASRLPPGTRVVAATDAENRDRYGRLLRHLFLQDGTNLQAALLEAGLARPLVMPPSLGFVTCYHHAADSAFLARRGLWGRADYQPVPARSLRPGVRRYAVVEARVRRVQRSRSAAFLETDGPLGISIPKASVPGFGEDLLAALPGTTIVVRGLVQPRGNALRLYLRHPVDLLDVAHTGNPTRPDLSNP